jgi:hypothetical protein
MTVAVLRNDKAISSVLAAPLMHILFEPCADVAGRNNSGAKQINTEQVCTAGIQKRARNLGVMREHQKQKLHAKT